VVGVAVVLAAAASIVFVANTGAKVEVSAAVERYLKSSLKGSSSSSEITVVDYTSFKSESPASPLFMQAGDHPVKLLLKKYGLTGTGKTLKTPKTSGGKKDADKGNGKGAEASSSTWVFGAIGAKADCSGREYTTAGIKANTCFAVEGKGMMLTCNSPDISAYMYDDDKCSGAVTESFLLGQTGCSTSLSTPWGDFAANDDAYTASVMYSCVTADAVKGPSFGDTHYDVLTGYTSSTCDASTYYYFEAYTGDTCIPFSGTYGGTNSANGGAVFKYNGDGAISNQMYAKFYAHDPTCTGPKYHATLPTGCIANTEADGAAQWLYYYVDNVYGRRNLKA